MMRTQKKLPEGVTVNNQTGTVTIENPNAFFTSSQIESLKRRDTDLTKPLTIDGKKAAELPQFKR